QTILEAAAGEHDVRFTGLARNGDNRLDEHVMEPGRYRTTRQPTLIIQQYRPNGGLPVDHDWCAPVKIERICFAKIEISAKLELHRRLTFEVHSFAQTDQR